MIQKPRYLLASVMLWSIFFCLKLFDDYDGIMSLIGAPFVATLLLAISLPIVLVLGLCRKMPWFAKIWYSGRRPAASVLIASSWSSFLGVSLGCKSHTHTPTLLGTQSQPRGFIPLLHCQHFFWRRSLCSTGLSEGNHTRLKMTISA